MQLDEFISTIEKDAPPGQALEWDNSGMQVATSRSHIKTVGMCLDPLPENISQALEKNCDFILCHHPLSIKPRLPDKVDTFHHVLSLLFQADTALYSAHTSLDVNSSGPVSWLLREMDLENPRIIMPTGRVHHEQLRFHPPVELSGRKKALLHDVEQIYEENGHISRVLVRSELADRFLQRLEADAGPVDCQRRYSPGDDMIFGLGLMGSWKERVSFFSFMDRLQSVLGMENFVCMGQRPAYVQKVAYCPGSGGDLASRAFAMGADVFLTGDVKYHQALDIQGTGLVLDVGHFILEEKMMYSWYQSLERTVPGINFHYIKGKTPMHISGVHALKSV